jgi:hypothetical protein
MASAIKILTICPRLKYVKAYYLLFVIIALDDNLCIMNYNAFNIKQFSESYLHLVSRKIKRNTAFSQVSEAQVPKHSHHCVQGYDNRHRNVENTGTTNKMIWMCHAVLNRHHLYNKNKKFTLDTRFLK